ncbi:MAG: tetratricopeptide repeat protein [bacterium]
MKNPVKILLIYLFSIFAGCTSVQTLITDEGNEKINASIKLVFTPDRRTAAVDKIHNQLASADEYIQTNRLYEAESLYLAALKQISDNSLVFYNLGIINDKLGKSDKADRYYIKSLEIDPKNADALYNIAFNAFKKSQYKKAVRLNLEALSIEPLANDIAENLHVSLYKAFVSSCSNNK